MSVIGRTQKPSKRDRASALEKTESEIIDMSSRERS